MHTFSTQMQIGLPITGKYRDPESDQYYNNNNVRVNLCRASGKLFSKCLHTKN